MEHQAEGEPHRTRVPAATRTPTSAPTPTPAVTETATRVRRSAAWTRRASASSLTPFRLLGILLLGNAAVLVTLSVFPSRADDVHAHPVPVGLDGAVTTAMVVSALFAWFVAPRLPARWGLDAAFVLTSAIIGLGAVRAPTDEAQLLVGFGLVVLGIGLAYAFPPRRMLAHLGLSVALFTLAVIVNPELPGPLHCLIVIGVVCGVALMVSALVTELRGQAAHDGLTGLLNRRGLNVAVAPIAAAARRSGTPITVGIIDLDDFKGFNDAHGHLAGDQLLVDVAAAWQSRLRGGDVLARFGGDEFALVLVGTDLPQAQALAARLRAGHPAPWTVGFAPWADGEDLYVALGRADENLLAAKRSTAADRPPDAPPA